MEGARGFEEFVAAVEGGSITAAAEALALPRPTVSRRLAQLEARLKVRLLHRTTRRLTMTPHGEQLYPRARRVVEAARGATAEVRRLDGVPRGLLRVSVPIGIPHTMMAGWVAEFLGMYPEVRLELQANSTHVDLVGEGFDVVLRRGEIEDPSLIARTITVDSTIAVASPAYLERAGTPLHLEDLGDHACIVGYRSSAVPDLRWPLVGGGVAEVVGVFATNDMSLRLEAAKVGVGISIVSANLTMEALASGALVHVLPELVGKRDRVSLVYAEREFLDAKVRAFVDFLGTRIQRVRAERGPAVGDGR
ncbi:MAG: LysR family transcriptional regulator [Nannocystales bacterium]